MWGVDTDSAGNVYLVDTHNARVQKLAGTGAFITMWFDFDGTPFIKPTGVFVDGDDVVYVCDSLAEMVYLFDADGAPLTRLIRSGGCEDVAHVLRSTPDDVCHAIHSRCPGHIAAPVLAIVGAMENRSRDNPSDNTGEVMARAGLGGGSAMRTGALLIFSAALGALVCGLFFLNGRTAAIERAEVAETSNAANVEALRKLTTERDELRGQVERLTRENAELLALKTKLSSVVAAKDEELAKENAARKQLEEKMKPEISAGDIALNDDGGRLRVDLVDKVLFDSGDATISKRGAEVLTRVGAVLAGVQGKVIQVSGHTDDSPPSGKVKEVFPTNWELSTARATNVVRFLQETGGIAGKRLVATGFGQFKPVTHNANHSSRARNRRIEILLVPELETVRSTIATKR